MASRGRSLVAAGCVLAAAVAAFLALRLRPVAVVVAPITRGRAVEAIYATGTVEPVERVVVKAQVSEHVAALLAREGAAVEPGQLLARIESPVRDLALSQAETQLGRARTQAGTRSPQLGALEAQARALRSELELARLELGRDEALLPQGATTKGQIDAARARVTQLEAQVHAADEAVRSARVDLAATRDQLERQVRSLAVEADEGAVRSPIKGVVLRREVELGEVVAMNQALFEVADTSHLVVELHVDEADIARVRDGAEPTAVALSFYAFPGRAFAGKVVEILPEPDRIRRAYTVRVRLDEEVDGLRVGMSAEANLIVRHKEGVLLVPIEALDGDGAWVLEGGRAARRVVTIGIRDLTHAEVDGLAEGAVAIIDAKARKLVVGARVVAKATAR